jgi:molybdopterin molybdotransferase
MAAFATSIHSTTFREECDMTEFTSIRAASCADDYDPDSMPVAQARAFIRRFLEPVTTRERLGLRAALGRVLAEDIRAPHDVPAHRNSAMDGWAFAYRDLTGAAAVALREVGTAWAGRPFEGAITPGDCIRIFTGAVVPDELDCVIMQERVHRQEDAVCFAMEGIKPRQNVRDAGEDIAKGHIALARGTSLKPADVGVIASLGISEVVCFRRLRVAFFSTGDELMSLGATLSPGQIFDSNRYTIHALLTRLGVEVLDLGVVRDDPAEIKSALQAAAKDADVVITSGGVSVGEADYVKQVLDELGEVVFWKIAMKPGRPLAYGRLGRAHFFGLPGNPVSVMATFYQFVRDALLTIQGVAPLPVTPLLRVECVSEIRKAPGRTEFQRGVLFAHESGVFKVRTSGAQGSGILKSMADANCFIVLGEAVGNVAAGSWVDVQVLEGLV